MGRDYYSTGKVGGRQLFTNELYHLKTKRRKERHGVTGASQSSATENTGAELEIVSKDHAKDRRIKVTNSAGTNKGSTRIPCRDNRACCDTSQLLGKARKSKSDGRGKTGDGRVSAVCRGESKHGRHTKRLPKREKSSCDRTNRTCGGGGGRSRPGERKEALPSPTKTTPPGNAGVVQEAASDGPSWNCDRKGPSMGGEKKRPV